MRIKKEKGQSLLEMMIILPIVGMMVMIVFVAGQQIYLKLASQNIAYTQGMALFRTNGMASSDTTVRFNPFGEDTANNTAGVGETGQKNMATFSSSIFESFPAYQFNGVSVKIDIGLDDFITQQYYAGQGDQFIDTDFFGYASPYMDCAGTICDLQ